MKLRLLEEILPEGLNYGANYLVEFEPQSLWYETSITLCAQALRAGIRTDYHTFTRPPEEVRASLGRLGVDVRSLEADDTFRVWDSFTVQTGLGDAEMVGRASPRERVDLRSVKMADWDKGAISEVTGTVSEVDRRRLHIDDNTSVLVQFNDEKSVTEHFRTLTIPYARKFELCLIHSISTGIYSESLSRQFEAFCDGVIDFRTREEEERLGHYIRVRVTRGTVHDSKWRRLEVLASGEVAVKESPVASTNEGQGPEGERRLAAIMFTDMVGFTALAQKDEQLAIAVLDEQRRFVRPILAKHKGREVKTIGDGFLVEFASALDAVRCALGVQESLRVENQGRTDARRMMVRIGVHLGDVVHVGADVVGDSVNVASRIEPLALPGGVCVSGQVYDSVVNKVDCRFERLGATPLKNVSVPVEVYRVSGLGEATAVQQTPGTGPRERVAILPLVNIGPDPNDEYFADGLTEELISSLSRIRGLRVIARTSVMRFKGKDASVAQIGRELGVANLLEGSVRKQGNKVRISVQLVDSLSEEPKWSDEYDRELQDIFAIQRDISQKVASALKVYVLKGEPQPGRKGDTDSLEAYEQYLRGRQLWNRRTSADLARSVECFEKALTVDPDYARAYSGLADSYAALALLEFVPPSTAFPKARDAVERALSIDPGLAEPHTSLGVVRFQYDWDWEGAEAEFRRAVELNENYAPTHQFFADYLKAMGRFDEAVREMEWAREIDPLSLAISAGLGHVLYLSRRYDEAIERYAKTVELDPDFMQTHLWFGRPYLEKGMFAEAISELQTAVRLSGESTLALGMLGHGLASAGRTAEANEILEKLTLRAKDTYVPSYWVAAVYNGMRNRGQLLKWLRAAFEERSSWLVWINVEPRFDWVRDDPGFAALLKGMKFPPR